MEKRIIPEQYQSSLDLHETQIAIKTVKDFFQNLLAERLNLRRVSAPLFVRRDLTTTSTEWSARYLLT